MPTDTQTPQVEQTKKVTSIILGKFEGAFSPFQNAAFIDLKTGGLKAEIAHKIAQDYGADIGNAMRNGTDFASKVAKAKKNGESRVSISGKGETMTSRTMSLVRVFQQVDALYKEGLLKSRDVDLDSLTKTLVEYLNLCELWTTDKTFVAK